MSYKIRRAILKTIDPHAFEHPLLKQLDEHETRIANGPVIQRRRAEVQRAHVRSTLPWLVPALVVNAAVYGAGYWYLPGLFTLPFAIGGAVFSSLVLSRAVGVI